MFRLDSIITKFRSEITKNDTFRRGGFITIARDKTVHNSPLLTQSLLNSDVSFDTSKLFGNPCMILNEVEKLLNEKQKKLPRLSYGMKTNIVHSMFSNVKKKINKQKQ